jgi:hypothetical protein
MAAKAILHPVIPSAIISATAIFRHNLFDTLFLSGYFGRDAAEKLRSLA